MKDIVDKDVNELIKSITTSNNGSKCRIKNKCTVDNKVDELIKNAIIGENVTEEDIEMTRQLLIGMADNNNLYCMHITSPFRVTDMDNFNRIVENIIAPNVTKIEDEEGKISLVAHGSLMECLPLHMDKDNIDLFTYQDEVVNTFYLIQKILPIDEHIVLTETTWEGSKRDNLETSTLVIGRNSIQILNNGKLEDL